MKPPVRFITYGYRAGMPYGIFVRILADADGNPVTAEQVSSLLAIARAAKAVSEHCVCNLADAISAHESKYGPIGGE